MIDNCDIVSFDVAKKLYTVGYAEENLHHYQVSLKDNSIKLVSYGVPKKRLHVAQYETYCAPSHDYIINKLRSEYNLYITNVPVKLDDNTVKYTYIVFNVSNTDMEPFVIISSQYNDIFDTPQEAVDHGILLALSNITFN